MVMPDRLILVPWGRRKFLSSFLAVGRLCLGRREEAGNFSIENTDGDEVIFFLRDLLPATVGRYADLTENTAIRKLEKGMSYGFLQDF